jgi:hypothetical protein
MLKACEQAVDKLGIGSVQIAVLHTQSSVQDFNVVSGTYFVRFLPTLFEQLASLFTQSILTILPVKVACFYTLPTGPINTNKLIKE